MAEKRTTTRASDNAPPTILPIPAAHLPVSLLSTASGSTAATIVSTTIDASSSTTSTTSTLSRNTTVARHTSCPLLDLSAELRNHIWSLVYTADTEEDGSVDILVARHPTTALLCTNSTILAETRGLYTNFVKSYYQTLRFTIPNFTCNQDDFSGLEAISDASLQRINHLALHVVGKNHLQPGLGGEDMVMRQPGPRPGGGIWQVLYVDSDFVASMNFEFNLGNERQIIHLAMPSTQQRTKLYTFQIRSRLSSEEPVPVRQQLAWLKRKLLE